MEISKYISELLFEHDCVIIPAFGGFVANYQPASIHPVQHRFDPPAKSILFNSQLKHNDGLLVSYIAATEKINYNEAAQKASEFVISVQQALNDGQKVSFENMGILFIDTSGNITFDQEKAVNYLDDVFGMDSFVSPAVSRQFQRPKPLAPKPESYENQNTQPQFPSVLLRIAASISVVFILSFLGYSLFQDNSSIVSLTGFLPTGKSAENAQQEITHPLSIVRSDVSQEPTDPFVEDLPASETTAENVPEEIAFQNEIDEPVDPIAAENVTPENTTAAIVEKSGNRMYHIIAGSFLENENAGNLIDFYRNIGYMPIILGPSDNGYFRVSIAAYLRKDEAIEELNLVRSQFNPNVWLLRQ